MKNSNNEFIFGNQVVNDLLFSYSHLILKFFLKSNHSLLPLVKKSHIPYQICEKIFFYNKFPHDNHQFIVAQLKQYQYYPFANLCKALTTNKQKNYLFLVLDHLNDPYNFGAIIRTAKATGVDAIIVANFNQAPINATTIKASAGAVFGMKIVQVANLVTTCKKLQKYHFWFYASAISSSAKNYRDCNYQDTNIGLIVGNEHKGVSKILKENTDFHIRIPVLKVDSLNVSNATAIILYEIRNQQKFWSFH